MKLTRSGISVIVILVIALILIAMIQAPSLIVPQSVKNARLAQEILRNIYYGEKVYRRLNKNRFGDLEQLERQLLIKGVEGNIKDGYSFDLKEKNESCVIVASPLKEGPKYFLDEEGIIHLNTEDGGICLPDGSGLSRTISDSVEANSSSNK